MKLIMVLTAFIFFACTAAECNRPAPGATKSGWFNDSEGKPNADIERAYMPEPGVATKTIEGVNGILRDTYYVALTPFAILGAAYGR